MGGQDAVALILPYPNVITLRQNPAKWGVAVRACENRWGNPLAEPPDH